jgi:hypothetical protein
VTVTGTRNPDGVAWRVIMTLTDAGPATLSAWLARLYGAAGLGVWSIR